MSSYIILKIRVGGFWYISVKEDQDNTRFCSMMIASKSFDVLVCSYNPYLKSI